MWAAEPLPRSSAPEITGGVRVPLPNLLLVSNRRTIGEERALVMPPAGGPVPGIHSSRHGVIGLWAW